MMAMRYLANSVNLQDLGAVLAAILAMHRTLSIFSSTVPSLKIAKSTDNVEPGILGFSKAIIYKWLKKYKNYSNKALFSIL